MDAPEVRALAQAGIEIGSHGLRHVRLPGAGDALAEEVGGSRRILQEITGKPVGGFCYPYGDLDAGAVAPVRDTGYDYGCAIWPSACTGRHALPRTYIGEADTAPRLWAKTDSAPAGLAARRRRASPDGSRRLNFPHSA